MQIGAVRCPQIYRRFARQLWDQGAIQTTSCNWANI